MSHLLIDILWYYKASVTSQPSTVLPVAPSSCSFVVLGKAIRCHFGIRPSLCTGLGDIGRVDSFLVGFFLLRLTPLIPILMYVRGTPLIHPQHTPNTP
jgi:hypothetical protein